MMTRIEAVEQILSNLRLSTREKQPLAQWLQQERMKPWGDRLDVLFKRIDARQKGLPRFSMAEIQREIDAVRREPRQ